ncbi:MAG: hypothetical protein R2874_03480 [Desulfobacterales bacterium]
MENTALISDLVRNGQFYHVLPFLDSRVLAESGDVLFLMDVLTFGAQVGTPEAAVDILESVLYIRVILMMSPRVGCVNFRKLCMTNG